MGPLLWWGNAWVWYGRAAFLLALAIVFGITASWVIAPLLLIFAAGYLVIARAKQHAAQRNGSR